MKNITQKQIPVKTGIAQSTVSHYFTGKRVSKEVRAKLDHLLGVNAPKRNRKVLKGILTGTTLPITLVDNYFKSLVVELDNLFIGGTLALFVAVILLKVL